jgi:polyisoprenoid-binding protein YceI
MTTHGTNRIGRLVVLAATLAGVASAGAASAGATTWAIDPAHTSVQFSIRHMMVSNVRGELTDVSGTVQGDQARPTEAVVEVAIDPASVATRDPKRDNHLRGPDFFDVAKYPTMVFKSKSVAPAGPGAFKVTGDLTMHGVTREIVLDVADVTPAITDPFGKTRAGARATTKLNRKDFGINWSKTMDNGGLVVGDEVAVTIDVEAVKQ